jgi:uncharacterized protein
MMHRFLPAWVLAMLGVVLLGLHGCASSPPTRFYVLLSLTGADPALPAAQRALTIGVGPVTLHSYLDRPQIVTRASRARLILGEFDQWDAPLRDGVTRSLAENLSLLVPTDRVVLHPWSRTTVPDYQVTVEVLQFDAGPGGEVVLAARWQILNADEKELVMHTSHLTAVAGNHEYEATVTAMGRALDALSRDIAAAPLLLPLAVSRVGNAADIGLVMAALSFGGLTAPLWGRLADGYRLHRFLLTGGLLVTAVALESFALVSTPIAWCGLAFLQGCTPALPPSATPRATRR